MVFALSSFTMKAALMNTKGTPHGDMQYAHAWNKIIAWDRKAIARLCGFSG